MTPRRSSPSPPSPPTPPDAPPAALARSARDGAARRRAVEVALVIAAALLAVYRTRERDFWFHLAAGRSILADGLPAHETWCLAAAGQWPWLGEWLFHVVMYGLRDLGGDAAIVLWRAAWAGLAMALALVLARGAGAGTLATALVAPLALAVTRARLAARPEQVTVAFALLFLVVLEHVRRTGRLRAAAWLVPVQVLWANLHPGWFLGPALAALYAVAAWLGREADAPRRALAGIGLAVVLYLAAAVTPQPLDTLSFTLLRDVFADPTVGTIEELSGWSWARDRGEPYTGFLALALAALVVGGTRAWRASPPLTLAAVGALAAGVGFFRLQALAALVALPVLAIALDDARRMARRAPNARPAKKTVRVLPFVPPTPGRALALLAAGAGLVWLAAQAKFFPPGVAPILDAVPVRAVALADSLGLANPVLNSSVYGGYILWARGADHPPLQDTRNLGSDAFRRRLARARVDAAGLQVLLDEWRFTHAILEPPASRHERLPVFLFDRPDWALVFADDAGLLYVRRDAYPEVAAAREYRLLSPDHAALGAVATRAVNDPELLAALTAELERARDASPWNARAHLWLGLLALARQDAAAALGHFEHVERLAPLTPGLALRQGSAYEMSGRRDAAREAYTRALRDTSDAPAAREALRLLAR